MSGATQSIRLSFTLFLLTLLVASSLAAQETPKLSPEERAALIAKRDELAKHASSKEDQAEYDAAQTLLDRVFDIEKSIFGDTHTELLGTLKYKSRVARAAEDWEGAIEYSRRAYEMGKLLYPQGGYQVRDIELALEEAQNNAERTDEQRRLLSQSAEMNAGVAGLHREGKHAEAIALLKRVVSVREEVLGNEHPSYATSLNNLAVLYKSMGDFAQAEQLFIEANAMKGRILGTKHPDYAIGLNNLASLREQLGDYVRTEPLLLEANAILEEVHGKEHPSYATSLNNLAVLYKSMGDYARAEPLCIEAKAIREKVLGKQHPGYATCLDNLAGLYKSMGEYVRAEPLYVEAKAIRENRLGEEHPLYAMSLNNLAGLYRLMGDYARAEPLYVEAKAIREKMLGKEHPHYAMSLDNLAQLYRSMGDYARAEPLHVEAKAIREKAFGKEHRGYAMSLANLALLYESIGDYARAEPLYVEAKAIRERIHGKEHPSYASSLNNLAGLYDSMGDYARAEPLYVEAKAIREKMLGTQHPDYARSLGNLASLYSSMGDYARAEPLYVEAKAIKEKVLGKEHPSYSTSLNNLAVLYDSMGDYARAEPLYVEAIAIREKVFGKDHPGYATNLSNLATTYRLMGDYARAEPLYVEAKAIRERVLGKDHPDYASSLNGLGVLYVSMEDYARAESLLVEAIAIREKVLGKDHPDYATSLQNLAVLYRSTGAYARAEPLFIEAKNTIEEKVLGKEHAHRAASLHNLAFLYHSMGDYARAEPLYQEAIDITTRHLNESAYVQSEFQQMLMSQSVRYQLDSYLVCCLEGTLSPQNAIERLALWKGAILRRGRDLRLAASDPVIEEQFGELQSVASRLSSASRTVPDSDKIEAWKKRIAALTERKRQLEVELSRRSAAFRDVIEPISFASIRESIPANAVLIDYLEYNGKANRSLVASIIRRDGDPVLVDLGSAEQAGAAIDTWRESFGTTRVAKAAGAELRKQLWQPLLEHIQDAELILVSTDGVLGRLPLGALPGRKAGSYLIEDHRLALIPVPQLLSDLVNGQEMPRLTRELLLIGDVDYGARSESQAKQSPRRKRPWERGIEGGHHWTNLDETRAEVEFIAGLYHRLFQPEQNAVIDLRKSRASESAFLRYAPNSMFIHLATHGFFAPPVAKSSLSHEAVAARGQDGMFGDHRELVRGYSPGQLSGLVFAGANDPPEVDSISDDASPDDGILTADEIAYLPLGGTRLVVLSACETGLGEVAGGEGLLGIQRSFQVAGAHSTVATLWKVNDAATRRMMQEFYTNYLDKEMSVLDALREAQLWAINNPSDVPRGVVVDRQVPIDHSTTPEKLSPRYWAPYVLSGDWR